MLPKSTSSLCAIPEELGTAGLLLAAGCREKITKDGENGFSATASFYTAESHLRLTGRWEPSHTKPWISVMSSVIFMLKAVEDTWC